MPELGRGLYAITPEGDDDGALLAAVEAALAGGVRLIQYRDKPAGPETRQRRAVALLERCRRHGARLIVNDDVTLARAVGADGVHLGRDDCPDGDLGSVRAALGPDAVIGVSCYADFELARAAAAAGADYLAFGAVFPSPTKPAAARASVDLISRAKRELALPVAAIGGITLANAPALIAAGADLLAVITDLFGAPDVAARAAAYQRLFFADPHHDKERP